MPDGRDDQRYERQHTTRATFLFAMLGARATELQSRELAALALSPKAHGVLTLLRSRGIQAQRELSQAMGIAASAVVALIDTLTASGMVQRRGDPRDRRRNAIEITELGSRAAQQADVIAERVEQEFLAPLHPDEQEALRSLLRHLSGCVERQKNDSDSAP